MSIFVRFDTEGFCVLIVLLLASQRWSLYICVAKRIDSVLEIHFIFLSCEVLKRGVVTFTRGDYYPNWLLTKKKRVSKSVQLFFFFNVFGYLGIFTLL